ncbi:MAG TPA: metallophosphoesterase [Chryseosolibacter sp.]
MTRLLLISFSTFFVSQVFAQERDTVVHSIFLMGDAGEPDLKGSAVVKVLREAVEACGENATVVFLGDNIYPKGMPERQSRTFHRAEISLQNQVGMLDGLEAKGIFIPGNHDWAHWGRRGLAYILNEQRWIDSLQRGNLSFLPGNGCPGPSLVALTDNTLLLVLDTQWFLHRWDKTRDAKICGAATTREALAVVEEIFKTHPGKRIIVAAHHPLITYGEHGGVFSWKTHLFPLLDVNRRLYLPLPVIGSLYCFYRKWFGSIQDTAHPVYKEFSLALERIMDNYPGSVYVAGHEHALQYIVKDGVHFIVSGAGSKTQPVKKKGNAVFAEDVRGFVRISIYKHGGLSFSFYRADETFPRGKTVLNKVLERAPASLPQKEIHGADH